MHNFTPKPRTLQDVCLVDADDIFIALLRRLKGNPCNALYLHAAIAFGIIGFFAIFALESAAFSKIDAAGEFPHHHNIKALCHDIFTQRAVAFECRVEFRRAQIGE